MATFCPLNSRRIKRSRASERSDQAIKNDFRRSRFLVPVCNIYGPGRKRFSRRRLCDYPLIVHPVMKKLPHPQVDSNSGIDILNPKARQHWMLPLGNLKPLLNTMAYCVQMMYARLYGYCSWLSKCSRCHPLLQVTLFKALVTHGYTH